MKNIELYCALWDLGYIDSAHEKFVWLPEMEFLTTEKMEHRKQIYSKLIVLNELTIFAINGGGDFFAWKNDDTVVFVEYETGDCRQYALNLGDAIFRRIIEFANGRYIDMCSNEEKSSMEEDDAEYYVSEDEAKYMIESYIKCFGEFFDEDKNRFLSQLVRRGFSDGDAFISDEFLNKLISEKLKVDISSKFNIAK